MGHGRADLNPGLIGHVECEGISGFCSELPRHRSAVRISGIFFLLFFSLEVVLSHWSTKYWHPSFPDNLAGYCPTDSVFASWQYPEFRSTFVHADCFTDSFLGFSFPTQSHGVLSRTSVIMITFVKLGWMPCQAPCNCYLTVPGAFCSSYLSCHLGHVAGAFWFKERRWPLMLFSGSQFVTCIIVLASCQNPVCVYLCQSEPLGKGPWWPIVHQS